MAFAFVRGNPDNLSSGQNAAMGDIQGPFYDIRDYLNSGVFADLVGQGILYLGEIRWIAVPAAPPLWLPCDGRTISRATYNKLFAAISTTYGVGDGVNTFAIPPVAGRTIVAPGVASGGTANRVAGATFGEEKHALTGAESGTNGSGATDTDGTHGHDMLGSLWQPRGSGALPNQSNQYIPNPGYTAVDGWTVADPDIFGISVTGTLSAHAHSLADRGADTPHENSQPSVVIPAYIYAGV